jgi:uncharacterized protein YkwD
MTFARRPLAVLTLFAAQALPGQQEPPDGPTPPPPVAAPAPAPAAIVASLRRATVTLDEAKAHAPHLPTLPVALRLQASDALRAAFVARQGKHANACRALARSIAQSIGQTDAKAAAKLTETADALRAKALAASRREPLTKERITDEIDPLVAQLEQLLWPARERVLERAPAAAEALARLRDERVELAQWRALYAGATVGLELHPDAEKHFLKNPPPPEPLPPQALDDEWIVWTLLALPLSARDRKTLETNETLRATLDPEEIAGTTALNRLRWLLGLPLVRIDDKLTLAARDHSTDMRTLDFFAHESPVEGKRTPGDRAARFGTSGGAENIARGHDTGPSAIRGWWYSPGHHRNMLGGHARVGLGRSGELWTQMFGS